MDWRNRHYYLIKFHPFTEEMRLGCLQLNSSVKIRTWQPVPKQQDEAIERPYYHYMISCNDDDYEDVEYELRKAVRRDKYCWWTELKHNECKHKKITCFDCKYHTMSDFYLECDKSLRINNSEICGDFERLEKL